MQCPGGQGASGPARISFFQGQGAEFSRGVLGSQPDCRGGRGGRGLRRSGDRPRHRPSDAAAVPPGGPGDGGGGGPAAGAGSGRDVGGLFQPPDSLAGHFAGGHSRPGPPGVFRPAAHGLRQPALLHHRAGAGGPAGGQVLLFGDGDGPEGGGPADDGGARLRGLRGLHRVLHLLRPAPPAV